MALVTPTLAAPVSLTDTSVTLSSATGVAAGMTMTIDAETLKIAQNYLTGVVVPVLRGQDGSAPAVHRLGANVNVGTAADFPAPPAGVNFAVTDPNALFLPRFSFFTRAPIPHV